MAVDALAGSDVPWKDEAVDFTHNCIFAEEVPWTPAKVALAAKLQVLYPTREWRSLLRPAFKHAELLNTANLTSLAKILKESSFADGDEDVPKVKSPVHGTWKPQLHFVWDILLDLLLPGPNCTAPVSSSFHEFFRIVVDGVFISLLLPPCLQLVLESLFSATSTPTRKYWGFQIFQKAVTHPHMTADLIGMVFTKNFMRCWINQLNGKNRLLNKIAQRVVGAFKH
jgi:DNA polymerase phi